jgi:allantoinase
MKPKPAAPPDLLIRRVRVPTLGPGRWDVVVKDGIFVELSRVWSGPARRELEGGDHLLLPGGIDTHVHLNEPGRTTWEGITTGTRALAAAGVTSFFDMPLNSSPPCTTPEALLEKRALMHKKSLLDFGLWGGLIPGGAKKISALARAGAVGIKAFLCPSGLEEFPASDEKTLRDGAAACAKAGLILAVHAEDPATLAEAALVARQAPDEVVAFLASRPLAVEEKAIETCLRVARATGCAFHIVHVSTPRGLEEIRRAARQGVKITAETCPHYLLLDPDLLHSLGGRAKCAPPLRPATIRQQLWSALARGDITTIGSDHSPCLPTMKSRASLAQQWGGISGAQHGTPLFVSAARRRRLSWTHLESLLSRQPAQLFGLTRKGRLQPGADADFALWHKCGPRAIQEDELLTRHPLTPYLGEIVDWEPAMTFVRGRLVCQDGRCARPGHAREIERNLPNP